MKTGILSFLALIGLLACNETQVIDPSSVGQGYYPIEIGQFRIYDIEEISYDLVSFDTSVYQLRETVFDSIKSSNQTNYLIRRDKRDNEMEEWVTDSIWSAIKTEHFVSVSENNVPFIKLTFPVSIGRTWDGNSLNSGFERTYYYQDLTNSIIDSIAPENHIRVIIEDIERNIVNQDERSEVFVNGIGLVEKDYLTLQFCTVDCNEVGEIQFGRSLKQTLIDIGNE